MRDDDKAAVCRKLIEESLSRRNPQLPVVVKPIHPLGMLHADSGRVHCVCGVDERFSVALNAKCELPHGMTRCVKCGDSRKHLLSWLYEAEIVLDPI